MLVQILHLLLSKILQSAVASSSTASHVGNCVSEAGPSGTRTMYVDCIDLEETSGLTLGQIVTNITNLLSDTIFFVSTAIFIYGAFLYVLSAFKEENKANGQSYMIGALIGLAIVLTAKVTLNLVLYFIYT